MNIDNSTYFALVCDQLAAGQRVRLELKGTSMQPTLIDGDVLTLEPLHEPPAVGDVVLFRYRGHHLLHRVVAVEGDRYTMRGDNCVGCEEAGREDIVAKLVAVEKRHRLRHIAVRWLGPRGRLQLRPWYFAVLAFLMWAPLNGVGIPLDNYILGLRADHLIHASVFIPCTLFLMDLFGRKGWPTWLTAVGIGLLTEGVQYLLPYRGFDVNDMVANTLGVTLGWVAILLVRRVVRRRRQYPAHARHEGCR